VAWLASSRLARHARICHDGCHPTSGQQADAQKNKVERNAQTSHLIRWSIQEIRRIAQRLAQKRIQPADIIAWSLWRRAHQAAAQKSHIKQNHSCNAKDNTDPNLVAICKLEGGRTYKVICKKKEADAIRKQMRDELEVYCLSIE
jgi:hypothetical protein